MRLWVVACIGCGRVGFDAGTPALDGTPPPPDGPLGVWGAPVLVVADSTTPLDDPSLTADELELFVNADTELRVLRRASRDDPWGAMEPVSEITQSLTQPVVSGDGLTLYAVDFNQAVISTRPDRSSPWSSLTVVPELNTPTVAGDVGPRPDELEAAVSDFSSQPDRIVLQRRADRSAPWGPREAIPSLAAMGAGEAAFGEGGLALYFSSFQAGNLDLYRAERPALDQPFGPPEPIVELNTAAEESDAWVSEDGRRLYFTTTRGGEREIYLSTR